MEWLLKWAFVASREDAVSLADDLLQLAHIQQISAGAPGNGKPKPRPQFTDSSQEFYRFVSSSWSNRGLGCAYVRGLERFHVV